MSHVNVKKMKRVKADSKEAKTNFDRLRVLKNAAMRNHRTNNNGFFEDIFNGALDAADEFGGMFDERIPKYAKVAKGVRDKFPGLRRAQSANIAKPIEKQLAKVEQKERAVLTGAPASFKRQYFHQIRRERGKNYIVGCELVKLLPAASYAVGDVIFQTPLNPTLMSCPKLRRSIKGYERFAPVQFDISIDSSCGNNYPGQFAILIDKDPKDPWTSGGESTARSALSHKTCRQHSLWQSTRMSAADPSMKWVDDSGDPDMSRFDSFGTFVVVCTQTVTSGPSLGVISCHYKFEVKEPAENDSLATGGSFYHIHSGLGGAGGTWSMIESGAVPAVHSDLDITIPNRVNARFMVPTSGCYFVSVNYGFESVGGGVSTAIVPPVVGNSTVAFSDVDVYGGVYGVESPGVLGSLTGGGFPTANASDRDTIAFVAESFMVYADAPWNFNIGIFTPYLTHPTVWSRVDVLVVALDALPFASLSNLKRAFTTKHTADALARDAKTMEDLKIKPLDVKGTKTAEDSKKALDVKGEKPVVTSSASVMVQPIVTSTSSTSSSSSSTSSSVASQRPLADKFGVPDGFVLVKKF